MENFPVVTSREPQRFAACFAAVASHPGAFAPLRLCPDRQGGDIDIYPQELLIEPMMGGTPIALEIIAGHPLQLGHLRGCTGLQGTGNRRLVGTPRPSKSLLHGGSHTN